MNDNADDDFLFDVKQSDDEKEETLPLIPDEVKCELGSAV